MRRRRLLSAFICLVLVCAIGPTTGVAQAQSTDTGTPAQTSSQLGLDLTSGDRTVDAKPELFGTLDSVDIGGGRIIHPNDKLTAAEYALLNQVITNSQQVLTVDGAGRAIGGTLNLALFGQHELTNMVIPQNVTTYGGTSGDTLSVLGPLTNHGTLLALPSTNTTSGAFNINAYSLFNAPGASITNIIPAALTGLIAAPTAPLNLNITTVADIVNHGTIFSAANLNINAGGSVINGITGVNPALAQQASIVSNLNTTITSAIGNIVNAGLINSIAGNINIQSTLAQNLILNNTNGIISAAHELNISNLNTEILNGVKPDLSVIGGTLVGEAISLNAPGSISAMVTAMTGKVNATGSAAHLLVEQGDLNLGKICLDGDPSFVSLAGNILLSPNAPGGLLQFNGQDLAVLAYGSVIADVTLNGIDLSSAVGNGGSLFISAGLAPSLIDLPTEKYSLGAPNPAGGSIFLDGLSLTTYSQATNGRGGNVTLIAHDDNTTNEVGGMGQVQVGSIITGAIGTNGTGGDVLVVAQGGPLEVKGTFAYGTLQGGNVEYFTGEPQSGGLEFTGGTKTAGSVLVHGDPTHDPVGINVHPGGFYFDSGSTALQHATSITLNGSGDINLSNSAKIVANDTLLLSRAGGITTLGSNLIYAENDLKMEAYGTGSLVDIGASSQIIGGKNVEMSSSGGGILVRNNSLITGFAEVVYLLSADTLTLQDDVNISSTEGNFLASSGDMSLGNGGSLFTLGSNIVVSGRDLAIGSNKLITSGLLQPGAPATGLLTEGDFTTFGGTYLLAERNVTIDSSITTRGLDLAVVARTGNMDLGTNNNFISHGGNLTFFSQGPLTGDSNLFFSRAVGAESEFDGGVIQLSSGFSFSPFVLSLGNEPSSQTTSLGNQILTAANEINAFIHTPDQPFTAPARDINNIVTDPTILGNNVEIENNGVDVGLVLPIKLSGGQVDISNSQLDLNKGAIFFESVGPTAQISMPNSIFGVVSYGVLGYSFTSTDFPALVSAALTVEPEEQQQSTPIRLPIRLLLPNLDLADINNQQYSRAITFSITLGNTLANREAARQRAESTANRASDLVSGVQNSMVGRYVIVDTGRTENTRISNVGNMSMRVGGPQITGSPLNITSGNSVSVPVRVSEQRSDLMLFTTAGQVMTGTGNGQDGSSVIGSKGTVMSTDNDKMVLHLGKVFANSGEKQLTIETDFGSVVLDKESSAAVVTEPGKPSRVIALGGKDGGRVQIKPRGDDLEPITLQAGEEAVVTLEPEDKPDGARGTELMRMVAIKDKVNVAQVMENESFYSAPSIRLGGTSRSAYERLLANMESVNQQKVRLQGAVAFHLKGKETPSRVLAEHGSIFSQEGEDEIALKHGIMFVDVKAEHRVSVPFAHLNVQPGHRVAVETIENQTRIRVFNPEGLTVTAEGGRDIELGLGQELLLQQDRPTKADSLPDDGLARRHLEQIHVASNVEGVLGDFSIFSALSASPSLKPLRSPQNSDDRKLNGTLLKSAAALDMVTGKRGRYFVQPKEVSAAPPSELEWKEAPDNSLASAGNER